MAIRRRLKSGFTLVELMIVVAIVGVLAVLAIYGVRKYIANAKTAEARNSLGQMAKDTTTAYEGERMTTAVMSGGTADVIREICGNASAAVPASVPKGGKYQSVKSDWSPSGDVETNKGFPCIKFEMSAPQYYSYMFSGTGAGTSGSFTTSANGDLNGDGQASTFSIEGALQGDGRLHVAPSIKEVSPEE